MTPRDDARAAGPRTEGDERLVCCVCGAALNRDRVEWVTLNMAGKPIPGEALGAPHDLGEHPIGRACRDRALAPRPAAQGDQA